MGRKCVENVYSCQFFTRICARRGFSKRIRRLFNLVRLSISTQFLCEQMGVGLLSTRVETGRSESKTVENVYSCIQFTCICARRPFSKKLCNFCSFVGLSISTQFLCEQMGVGALSTRVETGRIESKTFENAYSCRRLTCICARRSFFGRIRHLFSFVRLSISTQFLCLQMGVGLLSIRVETGRSESKTVENVYSCIQFTCICARRPFSKKLCNFCSFVGLSISTQFLCEQMGVGALSTRVETGRIESKTFENAYSCRRFTCICARRPFSKNCCHFCCFVGLSS